MNTIYDEIGYGYDATRKADHHYLDVACGTGNYTVELARFGGHWNAFDQSEVMLMKAKDKSKIVEWSNFSVDSTNFESNYFDGIICSLAVHHFPSLPSAFKEISRLLKRSGNIVLFTATFEQMLGYWLNEYFPNMMQASCERMPTLNILKGAIEPYGLKIQSTHSLFITLELQDFFLYSGKQRPEIYLDQKVRDGISSFRNLCAEIELDEGLYRLQSDIKTGAILNVIEKYKNNLGDYMFVVISKS